MESTHFDHLVRGLASGATRRRILQGILVGGGLIVGRMPATTVEAAPPKDKNKNVETTVVECDDQSRVLVTIGQSQSVAEQIEGETGVVILRQLTFFEPEGPETLTFTKGKGLEGDLVRCEGFSATRGVPFEALVTITPR